MSESRRESSAADDRALSGGVQRPKNPQERDSSEMMDYILANLNGTELNDRQQQLHDEPTDAYLIRWLVRAANFLLESDRSRI
jgi:hypothetical protein